MLNWGPVEGDSSRSSSDDNFDSGVALERACAKNPLARRFCLLALCVELIRETVYLVLYSRASHYECVMTADVA